MAEMSLSKLRKHRGVTKASITKLSTRTHELVAAIHPDVETAQRHFGRLKELDTEFKRQHYCVIDLVDDDDVLKRPPRSMDESFWLRNLITWDEQ